MTDGSELYGADFSDDAVVSWYESESDRWTRRYEEFEPRPYSDHALNVRHGYRWTQLDYASRALAFGGGKGDELLPVADRLGHVTIIEPVSALARGDLAGVPVTFHGPSPTGVIEHPDGVFDLITCFGALTYVANARDVFSELVRCLAPGGWLLIREPIVAMNLEMPASARLGNHGRGLPLPIFRSLVRESGLETVRETLCVFSPIGKLIPEPYNRSWAVRLDALLCTAMRWNVHYRADHPWQKLRPKWAFYALRRVKAY